MFVGARGQSIGGLLGGLIRNAAPLIKRCALALGKLALKTCLGVAGDVLSGHNIKESAKRRAKETGKNVISRVLGISGVGGLPGIRFAPRCIKRKPARILLSV